MKARVLKGYIPVSKVGEILHWPTWKVRRWLLRDGAAVRKGRHWYTTRSQLRAAFPHVYHELFAQDF